MGRRVGPGDGTLSERIRIRIHIHVKVSASQHRMSLVKAKDIPYEQQLLEKRISFVHDLKFVLEKHSLVRQTVALYTDLIEDILYDVCLDVHRDIVMGVERGRKAGVGSGGHGATRATVVGKSEGKGAGKGAGKGVGKGAGKGTGNARVTRKRGRDVVEEREEEREREAPHALSPSQTSPALVVPSMEEMVKEAALHYGSATLLGVQCRGSKGAVDMYGNEIPAVATELVGCPHCGRRVGAGRFAPHLEKCMGGGRR